MYYVIVEQDQTIPWAKDKAELTKIFGGKRTNAKVVPESHFKGDISIVAGCVYHINHNRPTAIAAADLEDKDWTFITLKLGNRIKFQIKSDTPYLLTEEERESVYFIRSDNPLYKENKELQDLARERLEFMKEIDRIDTARRNKELEILDNFRKEIAKRLEQS
jgi:hypothetical protein